MLSGNSSKNISSTLFFRFPCIGHTLVQDPSKMLPFALKRCVPPAAKTFFSKLHTDTLPAKVWLQERGMFVPWSVNCLLCKQPETVNHAFVYCWDAVLFWGVLQRTLKNDICVTTHTIRFFPVRKGTPVPYDVCLWF